MGISAEARKAIDQLLDELCALAAPGRGRRKLTDMFMDLVDREAYPDYYKAIPEPRSINLIKGNLEKGKYKHAEDVFDDLTLVMLNAEFYNEEGSGIWKDANTLKKWIDNAWKTNAALPAPRTGPLGGSPPKKKSTATTIKLPAAILKVNPSVSKPHQPTPSTSKSPPIPATSQVVAPSPLKFVHQQPSQAPVGSKPAPPPPTKATRPTFSASQGHAQGKGAASAYAARPHVQPQQQQAQSYAFSPYLNPSAGAGPSYYPTQVAAVPPPVKPRDMTPDPSNDAAARDAYREDIVNQLERGLPRWSGPGDTGWTGGLVGKLTCEDVIDAIKTYKPSKGKHPADALDDVPEDPVKDASYTEELSFRMIDTRASQAYYENTAAFDLEMTRFFEKARRHHDEGSVAYGNVLICQRLYHALTSPSPPSKPLQASSTNFASIPAGPGTAKPLHSADSNSEDGVTTFRISSKERTFTEDVNYKGNMYKVADWVHLMNPDDPSKPIVAQIFKIWISDESARKGQIGITACWYYRPEQTFHAETRKFWEGEVFKTSHFADHAVEDIIEKIAIQFTARHVRGRPRPPYWYIGWPLYVCDSRFNTRERVFVKIKNWNSCVPDEVRKKSDWMPIYPFEETVLPRSLESPFKRGITGPGGYGEGAEVEKVNGRPKRSPRRTSDKGSAEAAPEAPAAQIFYGGNVATPAMGAAAGMPYNQTRPIGARMLPRLVPQPKLPEDRSAVAATGGMANVIALEKLPPETAKLFDRHPDTNEVLWFSGPPVDFPRPRKPRYSMAYLHYLAKQKKRKRELAENPEEQPEPKTRKLYSEVFAELWEKFCEEEGYSLPLPESQAVDAEMVDV